MKKNWHLFIPFLLFAIFFVTKDQIQRSRAFLSAFDYLYRPFLIDDRFRVSHLYQRTFAQNMERDVLLIGSSSLEVLLRVKPYRLNVNSTPAHYMQISTSLYDLYFEREQISRLKPKKIFLYFSTLHLNDSSEKFDILDGPVRIEEIKTLLGFKKILDQKHIYMSYFDYFMRKEYFLRTALLKRDFHDYIPSGFYSGILKLPSEWNDRIQDDFAKPIDRIYDLPPNTEALRTYSRLAEDFNIYLLEKMLDYFEERNIVTTFIEQRDNPLCHTKEYKEHREETLKKLTELSKRHSFTVIKNDEFPYVDGLRYSDCVHLDSPYLAHNPAYIEKLFYIIKTNSDRTEKP